MKWIKKLLGLNTPLENKKNQLSELRTEAFHAQRNGDLRKVAQIYKKIETLEDEIVEMVK